MGDSVIRAAEGFDGIVVAIAGSGHLSYNLGINRRVFEKRPVPFATVLAVFDEGEGRTRAVRSLAHYFWGVPYDLEPAFYPGFGFRVAEREGKLLAGMVMPGSLAQKAGLKNGDRIVSLDGDTVSDVSTLFIRLSEKKWGDAAILGIERGDEAVDITIQIEK
jgi:S1-C subfamily serine protease